MKDYKTRGESLRYRIQLNLFTIAVILLVIPACTLKQSYSVGIDDQVQSPGTDFAISELTGNLAHLNHSITENEADLLVRISVDENNLKSQEYTIHNTEEDLIIVTGGDIAGAMYGIMDLAEQVSFSIDLSDVKEIRKSPFIEKRGIKMNIPLDGRLPSYDDTGDAAQNNII